MPEIVVKTIDEDGTEHSIGPLTVPKTVAREITRTLEPLEAKRLETLEADRAAEAAADQERRSKEAEAHNQARIEEAAQASSNGQEG